jgi:haloalkane dehalogenase
MVVPVKSLAEVEFGLEAGDYPFESRFFECNAHRLHYIDEGTGSAIFFLHGNPSWSYMYRNVILGLRRDFRCIAVDLSGFGLSVPAPGFTFLPSGQARLIAGLLDHLDLHEATLVAHDWGGPIGIAAMFGTPGRITRLVLGNTWAWDVSGDWHFEWFSRLMGGAIGRWAANRFAIFVDVVMPTAMKRRKLTAVDMAAYRAPFQRHEARRPMHILPHEIIASGPWLRGLEDQLRGFKGEAFFIWPDSDIAFRAKELARWQTLLPQAQVRIIQQCGHFLWEDAPGECIGLIREAMGLFADPAGHQNGQAAKAPAA